MTHEKGKQYRFVMKHGVGSVVLSLPNDAIVMTYEYLPATKNHAAMWFVEAPLTKERFAVYPEELLPLENEK